MAYSIDLRERIVQAVDDGMTKRRAARIFRVGLNTVKRYVDQYHQTRNLKPKPIPGRPPKIKEEERPLLVSQVEATPDASLAEHCESWARSQGIRLSQSTMCRMLKLRDSTRIPGVKWTRKRKRH